MYDMITKAVILHPWHNHRWPIFVGHYTQYSDVICVMVSQIIGILTVCARVCPAWQEIKLQNYESLGVCEGNLPATSGFLSQRVSRKPIPFHDVIMKRLIFLHKVKSIKHAHNCLPFCCSCMNSAVSMYNSLTYIILIAWMAPGQS